MLNKQINSRRTQKVLSLITLLIMLVIEFTKVISVNAGEEPLKSRKIDLFNVSSIVDNIRYNPEKETKYKNGDIIKFQADWSLPDDNENLTWVEGDNFTLELPKELKPKRKEIYLGIYGKGIYDEKTNSYIFEFTENINYKQNRHGGFNLELEVNLEEEVDKPVDISLIIKEDGKPIFNDNIVVEGSNQTGPTPIPNDGKDWNKPIKESLEKQTWGGIDYYTGIANWWLRINYSGKNTGHLEIKDTLGQYHRYKKESFKVYKKYTNGYETYPAVKWNGQDKIDVTDEVDLILEDNYFILNLYPKVVGYDLDGDAITEWFEIEYQTEYDGSAEEGSRVVLTNKLEANNKDIPSKEVELEYDTGGWGTATNQYGEAYIRKIDKETGKPLEGAKFKVTHQIYKDLSETLITDKEGKAKITLNNMYGGTILSGKYKIEEIEAPNGYKLNEKPLYVVFPFLTNSIEEVTIENEKDTIDLTVNKLWKNLPEKEEKRDVKITLLADNEIVRTIILRKNQDKYIFKDLPRTDKEGNIIKYTIKESYVNEEDSIYFDKPTIETIDSSTILLTNTRNNKPLNELKDITVEKIWEDLEYIDYIPSIKAILYANDELIDEVILSKDNLTHTFEKLDTIDSNGNEIKYTVEEVYLNEDLKNIFEEPKIETIGSIVTITNKEKDNEELFVDVPVKIKWGCKKRPETEIHLTANGERIDTGILSDDNNYEYVFENLPLYNNKGEKIDYDFEEISIPGYDINIKPSDSEDIEYEIMAIPENIEISLDVLDNESNPLDDAEFVLIDKETNEIIHNSISKDGKVSFPKVPNKEYLIKQLRAPLGYVLSDEIIEVKNSEICTVNGFKVVNNPLPFIPETNIIDTGSIATKGFLATIVSIGAIGIMIKERKRVYNKK